MNVLSGCGSRLQQDSLDRSCARWHVGDFSFNVCLRFGGFVFPQLGEDEGEVCTLVMLWPESKCNSPGSFPLHLTSSFLSQRWYEVAAAQPSRIRKWVALGSPLAQTRLFFCTETGSPRHFCLRGTTSLWLQTYPGFFPAVYSNSLNYFPNSPPTPPSHKHTTFCKHTHRHSNTFVS